MTLHKNTDLNISTMDVLYISAQIIMMIIRGDSGMREASVKAWYISLFSTYFQHLLPITDSITHWCIVYETFAKYPSIKAEISFFFLFGEEYLNCSRFWTTFHEKSVAEQFHLGPVVFSLKSKSRFWSPSSLSLLCSVSSPCSFFLVKWN